jgi:flavoprotein
MDQISIEFEKRYDRKPGYPRKQFKSWKIPAEIILDHFLLDGTPIVGTVTIGSVSLSFVSHTTSGGEFSIGKGLADILSNRKRLASAGSVKFRILVEMDDFWFQREVTSSLKDTVSSRLAKIKLAEKKPAKKVVQSIVFIRNPDIVAQKLYEAAGRCQRCQKSAPFNRKIDNIPYLEVHHINRLADGGDDTLKNTIALCPNCHRQYHYGCV